ncbi:unnamed protein product [Caenorhabditis auriculariae]|uniref:Uncharacterized protein n=1 Tax=Caenorhabditis auriculariae TaxID=2777116 RepID=A0A8S1GT02_9PELO|nr:unnamed protein product [Caenorhabditis auriculariae]
MRSFLERFSTAENVLKASPASTPPPPSEKSPAASIVGKACVKLRWFCLQAFQPAQEHDDFRSLEYCSLTVYILLLSINEECQIDRITDFRWWHLPTAVVYLAFGPPEENGCH